MIQRKTFLILILCIIGLTAVYLYYVKKERRESVLTYLPNPREGDVYKMEHKISSHGQESYYLQVKDATAESVFFYQSRMTSPWGANDIFLRHFDSSEVVRFSKKELEQIKDGQWNTDDHDFTTLLEISRK